MVVTPIEVKEKSVVDRHKAGEVGPDGVHTGGRFQASEFPKGVKEDWTAAGFSALDIGAWSDSYGFTLSEATRWSGNGFSADDAVDWGYYGFEYNEARVWRDAGFQADQAEQALMWKVLGVSPNVASQLARERKTPLQASRFLEVSGKDIFTVQSEPREMWRAVGFDDLESEMWIDKKFSIRAATAWKKNGISPLVAASYREVAMVEELSSEIDELESAD
jgi:hypothetical protein